MQVSLQWLNDYIELNLSPEKLAEALTMVGLEVESIKYVQPQFSGVLVGQIKNIPGQSQAGALPVCIVDAGGVDYQVVCGATNIFEGALAPLALPGATLGGNVISVANIKGVRSEGMLCSDVDLGIGFDHSGIMILEEGLAPGSPLEKVLPLSDVILEVSVTPNRADCLSLLGIAREVAAIVGGKMKYPLSCLREQDPEATTEAGVTIVDPDLCPRYAARVIRKVKIAPSPFWLRQKLISCGLRPINNVVDITNFVMMEMGQPLHAFDLDRLAGRGIIVRRAQKGEPFTTLDGKEHLLNGDTLMICDREKPVAIAGIMGGKNSEVTQDTENILLESAYFSPSSIRRSAKALNMNSDASYRFERGIDPEGVIRALDRAAELMDKLAGGIICRGRLDAYPRPIILPVDIVLRIDKANRLLKTELSGPEMADLLRKIEFQAKPDPRNPGCYLVTPPSSRVDIRKEIDIIEEIIRIYGYDKVGVTIPAIGGQVLKESPLDLMQKTARQQLTGMGFTEVINYSFITESFYEKLNLTPGDERRVAVKIANPLTEEQAVMRTTLIFGLLENWRRNANFGSYDLRLFEIGRVFFPAATGELPQERNMIAALATGRRLNSGWDIPDLTVDFFDLKGWLESLLNRLWAGEPEFCATDQEPFLHPGRAAYILAGGKRVGFLGELNPATAAALELKDRVVVGELDLDKLASLGTRKVIYKDISRFPAASRDAAFIIPQDLAADNLIRTIRETQEVLLEKVEVFDLYTGPGLTPGTKSLGLRFTYRAGERTLTDIEINETHQKLIDRIRGKTGASLRGATNLQGGM